MPDAPFLGLEGLEAHTSRVLRYERAGALKSSAAKFSAGEVLYSRLRPYLNKVTVAEVDGLASAEFLVMRPGPGVEAEFVRRRIMMQDFLSFTADLDKGDRPRVDFDQISKFELGLPPAAEQKRIVAKVDRLTARTARARAELDRIPALVATYKQSFLAAAFTGALTDVWRQSSPLREDNAISALAITEERDAMRRTAGMRPKGGNRSIPKGSFALKPLPPSWEWLTFNDIAWDLTVGHVGPMKDRYVLGGTPFLRSLNVKANRLQLEKVTYIDDAFDAELAKSRLLPGDLVVVRTGEPGVAAVIPDTLPRSNCSDLVICRLVKSVNPHFAAYYMNSEFAKGVVRGFQVGVAQQHFNVGAMSEMPVPLPPRIEQNEIVRQIEAAFGWLDTVAVEAVSAAALLPKLNQAILAKAFRGELVPQDPADEPASVLLDRVRADRAAAPALKRRARA